MVYAFLVHKLGWKTSYNTPLIDETPSLQFANFLEENFLEETVATIKELGDHVTNLQRVKPGHGEYHYDKHLSSQS